MSEFGRAKEKVKRAKGRVLMSNEELVMTNRDK